MIETYFSGDPIVYWGIAGILAVGIVGIKIMMINFDRKNKDKK